VTGTRVCFVDTYVLHAGDPGGLGVLVLRRASGGRCPGSWETVHGTIEAGETPVDASMRELREETGFAPLRLYNVSRVEAFYEHRSDEIALIPVFAAFVSERRPPQLSSEHDQAAWLAPEEATARADGGTSQNPESWETIPPSSSADTSAGSSGVPTTSCAARASFAA